MRSIIVALPPHLRPVVRLLGGSIFALLGWLALTVPASAQFEVCNQTLDVVNVAIGRQLPASDTFETEGWWTIGSNTCAEIIRDPLVSRYIWVFATDVFGQDLIEGTVDMCIGEDRFQIEGTESCWTRGYRTVPFHEVDTQDTDRWQLFLTEPVD